MNNFNNEQNPFGANPNPDNTPPNPPVQNPYVPPVPTEPAQMNERPTAPHSVPPVQQPIQSPQQENGWTSPIAPPAQEQTDPSASPHSPQAAESQPQTPPEPYQPEYSANPGTAPKQPFSQGDYTNPQQPPHSDAAYPYPNTNMYQGQQGQPGQPGQYQYSTNTGWQTPDYPVAKKQDEYQWNFDEYQTAHSKNKKSGKNKGVKVFAILMSSVFAVGLFSMAGFGIYSAVNYATRSTQEITPNDDVQSLPGLILNDRPTDPQAENPVVGGKLSTEQIVEKTAPSVVSILTYMTGVPGYSASSQGSGIIMSEDGYIVTNAHVVQDSTGIKVVLKDDTEYEGRLIGIDTRTDLAVIKIETTGLTPASFGNSDQVKVGEDVVAIGSPLDMGLVGSVSKGIVSGLDRTISASGTTYSGLIQTDAAINPGNSGGALVNQYGQVIGINSVKVVSDVAEGIGFAIASNDVKPIVDDLIQYKRVTGRVQLGIVAVAIDETSARMNGVPTGLFVQSTDPNSDIAKKGVLPGDIITKINDIDIASFEDLRAEIDGKKPGDTVNLEIFRPSSVNTGGKYFSVTISLQEDLGTTTPNSTQQQPEQQIPEQQVPYEQDPGYSEFDDFFGDLFPFLP